MVLRQIKIALILLLLMTVLTGLIYPLLLTGLAQLFFPFEANGSLIETNGKIVGSKFIGQYFNSPHYFWGRPSATLPYPYNAASSAASNLGPSNPRLLNVIQERINTFQTFSHPMPIPVELVMTSGSGLDPDISPEAAFFQIPRIATARHQSEKVVAEFINQHIQKRTFLILGEPRINVLELNLALDQQFPSDRPVNSN